METGAGLWIGPELDGARARHLGPQFDFWNSHSLVFLEDAMGNSSDKVRVEA